jgi:hypothetical protein
MQTIEELEKFYEKEDPWEFKTHPDDQKRKDKILMACRDFGPYKQALDIGCGEGWITKDLPAKKIFGHECSVNARSRWPKKIKDIALNDTDKCDLVVATGVLYPQYFYASFIDLIYNHASKIIITCNIKEMEIDTVTILSAFANQILTEQFNYRQYIQVLRVFKKS